MRRISVWEESSRQKINYPKLEGNMNANTVIIGGGITGLTAALLLQEKGQSIALIEAREIGSGTTGLSSCHLTTSIDEGYRNITENFDLETASLVASSRMAAISFIEKTTKTHHIDCDFKRLPGYLYTEIAEDVSGIKEEFSYAAKAGLNVKLLNSIPLPFETKKSIRFENQAAFNSKAYLNGLAGFLNDKIQLFENSPVTDVKKEGDYFLVETNNGKVKTSKVILATHLPLFINPLQTLAAPYISYMLAAKLNNKEYAEALFWDTVSPYHYTRYYETENGNYIIIGGADHKTGHAKNTEEQFAQLEKYVRSHFNISSIEYKWSAQYYEPADGLPYIGKNPFSENLYVATGFSGDGLVYGTIAGIILSDLILGKENEWHKVYDSTRFTPAISAADFIKENTDVAKHFIKDRLNAGDENINNIQPGEGKIVKVDGHALAVTRNTQGEIKAVSAVCPHLKCLVNWNNFEQTWDCPCHGSRFDADGEVIYGPSVHKLESRKLKEKEKTDKDQ